MNGRWGAVKSYTIDTILTTLVKENGLDKYCYLELDMTGKAAYLIGQYTAHSHQFGVGIPVHNKKLHDLLWNKLKDEQARLKNLDIIFIDEYSMLRQKELFYIS